jgi:hypothetical protein
VKSGRGIHAMTTFLTCCAIVCLSFPTTVQGDEPSPPAVLQIEIQRRGDSKAVLKGDLSLRPADGKGSEIVLPLPADGGLLEARLPERSSWTLVLKSPEFWAPRETVTIGAAGSVKQYVLSLWARARLSGSVRMVDKGELTPREITARISTPASGTKALAVPKVEVTCPVDEKGAWTCELPAGVFDASFRAGSFVPSYRWGLVLRAGETSALGVLEMRKGASLAGWVEVEEGKIDPATCVARLSPLSGPGRTTPTAEERLKKVFLDRKVGKDGFFQIDGVAPGSYQLEIQQPGYAPARAFPLEVWEGSETLLRQALFLRRPLELDLTIEPPLDWLGKPWQVTVERKSDFSGSVEGTPAFQGSAGLEGRIKVAGQAPGRFVVHVADSLGNNLHHERDLPIEHAGEAQQVIEVNVIAVQGRITLGREPLASTLWFGGRFGAVRVKMSSDEEGEFEGVLPRGGSWKVEVQASDPKLDTEAKVEVEPDPDGDAKVEIRLPNTYVFGKVVDEAGRPISRARVDFGHLNGAVAAESGEGGEFDLHAVPEGRAELSATFESRSEGSLTSDVVMIDVPDSVPVGPMNLILRKTRILHGRVQSPRGPVAGAMLRVVPFVPPLGSASRTRSELDGSFSVRVDGKAESMLAIVSPPGHALQVFEVSVKGEPVVLNVSPDGGTLEVALPFSLKSSEQVLFIWQNRLPLDLGSLVFWAEGHGIRFEDEAGLHIPRLAPGDYEVCYGPITFSDPDGLADWKTRTATCASGSLGNGATLRLNLKAKAEAGGR